VTVTVIVSSGNLLVVVLAVHIFQPHLLLVRLVRLCFVGIVGFSFGSLTPPSTHPTHHGPRRLIALSLLPQRPRPQDERPASGGYHGRRGPGPLHPEAAPGAAHEGVAVSRQGPPPQRLLRGTPAGGVPDPGEAFVVSDGAAAQAELAAAADPVRHHSTRKTSKGPVREHVPGSCCRAVSLSFFNRGNTGKVASAPQRKDAWVGRVRPARVAVAVRGEGDRLRGR
jgi:hypothetical protein